MQSTGLVSEKEQILEREGYRYNLDRELYLNRKTKKALSARFVRDHSAKEIESSINEDVPEAGEWRFYFNDPPTEPVRQQLTKLLG